MAIAKKKQKTQEGTKQKKPWMAINELHMLKASVVQEGKKDGTHLHASVEEDDEDTEQSHTCLYRIFSWLHGEVFFVFFLSFLKYIICLPKPFNPCICKADFQNSQVALVPSKC